ncbi:DMT family transporter [Hazenella coriacea]|uniref:Drug/metabolite transporter (DMT)-like permease n=1 Tax=Hazenella coriacea TaxID=1179467 RepID=A0A4R3L8W1_9BACL|nr:DMT family transporter [Hazenella coriacea]TCS96471.1 drug/metabolite transporter (DMT)-like permease [Hazenella coriacea]
MPFLQQHRWMADGIILLISFIWGATFVLVQDAIDTLPPFSFLTVRFGMATLLLFLFVLITRAEPSRETPRQTVWIGGMTLGIFLFLGYAFQTFSLLYTTSGKAGFLTGVSVVLVPVLSIFILKTRIKLAAIIGVSFAVIGLYLLTFQDFKAINQGDLLAFTCAIFFALQVIFTGKYSSRTSIFHLVTIQMATVTFLSGLFAFIFEPWQRIFQKDVILNPSVLIALLITAIFATALAFLGQTYVQRFTTPTRVALIFATEPVFAALADYWWQGVTLGGSALIGCLFILGGMILSEIPISLKKDRKKIGYKRSS